MTSRPMQRSTGTEGSQPSSFRNTHIRTNIPMSVRGRSQPTQRTITARLHRSAALQVTSNAVTISNTNSGPIRTTSTRTSTGRSIAIATSANNNNNTTTATRRLSSLPVRPSPYNLRQSILVNSQPEEKVKPKRSACCEVFTQVSPKTKRSSINMMNIYYCPICFTNVMKQEGLSLMGTDCGHLFCEDCILQAIEKRPKCPLCLSTITKNQLREFYL